MTPLTFGVAAFFLAGFAFIFMIGGPVYAIPLVAIILGTWAAMRLFRGRLTQSQELREFRGEADKAGAERDDDFTDRDRETLYSG